jgi:transcriptional regulator with XRE-family HTH domain
MVQGVDGEGFLSGGSEPEVSDSLKAFGSVLRAFRRRAGLTQEEFAEAVRYSVETVSKIERGCRFPQPDFVEKAEQVLDAFGALRGAAEHLSRQPGLASWFRQWARLETVANSLSTYECRVIPGLLQTDAYARAVTVSVPPVKMEEQIQEQLAARDQRRKLLDRRPPIAFSFIIEESLILRRTGGTEVMREQVDHLVERAERLNVELQIMPLVAPDHAGFDGALQVLETVDNRWYGYAEGQRGGILVKDLKEVSIMQQRYAKLRSQALTPEDSKGLLRRMRGAL